MVFAILFLEADNNQDGVDQLVGDPPSNDSPTGQNSLICNPPLYIPKTLKPIIHFVVLFKIQASRFEWQWVLTKKEKENK